MGPSQIEARLYCALEESPPKSRRSRLPVPQYGGGRDHLGAVWSRCLEPPTCFPRRRATGRRVHCVAPQCGSCASSRSIRTRTSARSSAQNASTWESSPLNDDSPCREQQAAGTAPAIFCTTIRFWRSGKLAINLKTAEALCLLAIDDTGYYLPA
jgi:hypothetical protein